MSFFNTSPKISSSCQGIPCYIVNQWEFNVCTCGWSCVWNQRTKLMLIRYGPGCYHIATKWSMSISNGKELCGRYVPLSVCLPVSCLSVFVYVCLLLYTQWRHHMETFAALLAFWGIHRSPAYFAVYGFNILCKISKSTFEILNPYTAKYAFYCPVLLVSVTVSLNCDVISLSETGPCCSLTLSYFHLLFVFPHNYTATHLSSLLWCNNGRDGISNHQPHDCLLNQSFRRGSKKTSKLIKVPRQWPLCGEFTGDRWIPRTNGQWRGNYSIWWRHHLPHLYICVVYLSTKCTYIAVNKNNPEQYG